MLSGSGIFTLDQLPSRFLSVFSGGISSNEISRGLLIDGGFELRGIHLPLHLSLNWS